MTFDFTILSNDNSVVWKINKPEIIKGGDTQLFPFFGLFVNVQPKYYLAAGLRGFS